MGRNKSPRLSPRPGATRVDSFRVFCQTIAAMESVTHGFIFRNRRFFLLALAVVVFLGFRPAFSHPSAEHLARLLETYAAGPGLAFWRHVAYGLAAMLVALGALWRSWGSAYLGANVVQDRRMHTDRLVADGPYRRTRNPLYFGNMLMVLGLGLLLNPLPYAILVVGMWILVRLFIRDEEAGLEQSGGDSYRAYCAAVPRMLPSWRPRIPAAGAQPRWLQGFCGEAFLWVLAILIADSAIVLAPGLFHSGGLYLVAVALVLYVWARFTSRRLTVIGSS
jgi:protein-S-isoprenylcysteine O-methyltransferase Ste14